jgi:4-oxalocrotonate tautomerase
MPIVNIKMLDKGRTLEQKREMVKQITDTLVNILGTKRENVKIVIEEIPISNYATDGVLYIDKEGK